VSSSLLVDADFVGSACAEFCAATALVSAPAACALVATAALPADFAAAGLPNPPLLLHSPLWQQS
jgi:hypothetical protein